MLVVSDLHLGAVPPETERSFREFRGYAASEASGLLINGDLFEFGIAYRPVVPRKHVRVLTKLAAVVDAGLPVYFVAGNHDHLDRDGHILVEDLGITLLPDPDVLEIAGRRALITHGDTVGAGATPSRIEPAFGAQPPLSSRSCAGCTPTGRHGFSRILRRYGGTAPDTAGVQRAGCRQSRHWCVPLCRRMPSWTS